MPLAGSYSPPPVRQNLTIEFENGAVVDWEEFELLFSAVGCETTPLMFPAHWKRTMDGNGRVDRLKKPCRVNPRTVLAREGYRFLGSRCLG